MRLSVDAARRDGSAATGSPGLDSCRWLKPVRPGDVLTGRTEVLDQRCQGLPERAAEIEDVGDCTCSRLFPGEDRQAATSNQ